MSSLLKDCERITGCATGFQPPCQNRAAQEMAEGADLWEEEREWDREATSPAHGGGPECGIGATGVLDGLALKAFVLNHGTTPG
jgi:hypothetical protein